MDVNAFRLSTPFQQSVRMHNKTAGLLMESGVSFHKTKLHSKKYFADLIKSLEEVPEPVKDLLRMSRGTKDMFEGVQKQLLRRLLADAALKQRVERLSSIDGVGAITALTWALEAGDPHRFVSIADAVSYCGLTAAFRSSAGKQQREGWGWSSAAAHCGSASAESWLGMELWRKRWSAGSWREYLEAGES
jgi:transposase